MSKTIRKSPGEELFEDLLEDLINSPKQGSRKRVYREGRKSKKGQKYRVSGSSTKGESNG
jgi:hypothetical protein